MMTEFKGTPGPWFAVHNDHYWDINIDDSRYSHSIGDACASEHGEGFGADIAASNARLIAAAPELLEALLDARSQLEVYEWEATGEDYNDTKINSAIAKALGTES